MKYNVYDEYNRLIEESVDLKHAQGTVKLNPGAKLKETKKMKTIAKKKEHAEKRIVQINKKLDRMETQKTYNLYDEYILLIEELKETKERGQA